MSTTVSNPYSFNIKNNTIFTNPQIAPETVSIIKVYGTSPWYSSNWSESSKVKNLITINGGVQFEVSGVTNMRDMFFNCQNLISIDVSNLITNKVTNMNSMFSNCKKLTSIIGLTSFDTSNVTDMSNMFDRTSLKSLDLSSFDFTKVTRISSMFYNCTKLTSINCPNGIDFSNLAKCSFTFDGCGNLTTPIHLKNVSTRKILSGSSPDDWVIEMIGGTRGIHYIVDSVTSS